MKMIEAAKVTPLVRLLLYGRPNIEAIVKDVQEFVDIHTIDAERVTRCKDCVYNANGCCTYSENYDDTKYRLDYYCADAEPKARDEE